MLPDWVSNPGPLTYKSGALPTALRGPASPFRYNNPILTEHCYLRIQLLNTASLVSVAVFVEIHASLRIRVRLHKF